MNSPLFSVHYDARRLSKLDDARQSTPRSLRKAGGRASPRPRTRERREEENRLALPLVLLHVTLLPVSLPWSAKSMRAVLPESFQQDLSLLETSVDGTVLQRGILIPHPQDGLDLVEDRLLVALELRQATIARPGSRQWRSSCSQALFPSSDTSGMSAIECGGAGRCDVCNGKLQYSAVETMGHQSLCSQRTHEKKRLDSCMD